MADRRRVNGPQGGTKSPAFVSSTKDFAKAQQRQRRPNELRRVFLKTGVVQSASGSAYLELATSPQRPSNTILPQQSTVKLTCTVHGPKPLPRTASFTPNLQLSANVKIAPFATRSRRGYIRDAGERDLGVHLEAALRGVVLAERYPKSAIDISITVLEAEEDSFNGSGSGVSCGAMNVLAGCITVASAALADARIDCLDLVTGGVAVITDHESKVILDPAPSEHSNCESACVVAYLPTRDEITELWLKGDLPASSSQGRQGVDIVVDAAVGCAKGVHTVLQNAVKESMERWYSNETTRSSKGSIQNNDTMMKK